MLSCCVGLLSRDFALSPLNPTLLPHPAFSTQPPNLVSKVSCRHCRTPTCSKDAPDQVCHAVRRPTAANILTQPPHSCTPPPKLLFTFQPVTVRAITFQAHL